MRHTSLISRALQAMACASVLALAGCGGGSDPDSSAPKPESPPLHQTSVGVACLDYDGNQVMVPPKTITIHNDSDGTIYPVLVIGAKGAEDQWVQACLRTREANNSKYVYKAYVNEGQGIPSNSSVTITLPVFSELPAGTLPDGKYITWWNGGRVVLADRTDRLRIASDKLMGAPEGVSCEGKGTACDLSVYAGTEGLSENTYAQLSEYTFGDSIFPPKQNTRLLIPDNVGYNISYVDHVYLPVAIGPKNNPYIGYSGSAQPLGQFRTALEKFLQNGGVGEGWPLYNLGAVKLPGGYNIFAQRPGTLSPNDDVPVKPADPNKFPPVLTVLKCLPPPLGQGGCNEAEKETLHFGPAVQNIQNLWGTCISWTPEEDAARHVTGAPVNCSPELKAKLEAVKAFFKKSHEQYLALLAGNTCTEPRDRKLETFTYLEALKHIYGWVPFNEGCGAAANPLKDTVIPGWTHATIQPMYIHDLQYNHLEQYVKDDPKLTFNPYVKLIHDDLQMSAYGFSVDDAVGFMTELGDGLIFTVGGSRGLENERQFTYPGGFSLTLGVPGSLDSQLTQPLIKKYGVCAMGREAGDPGCEQDKQDVSMPAHTQIAGFRVGTVESYPVKVRFTDLKDNQYTFVIKARFPECKALQCLPDKALVIDPADCRVIDSSGALHPKSGNWCGSAYPYQSRDPQAKDAQTTKNFLQTGVPVDYQP